MNCEKINLKLIKSEFFTLNFLKKIAISIKALTLIQRKFSSQKINKLFNKIIFEMKSHNLKAALTISIYFFFIVIINIKIENRVVPIF